MGGLPDEREPLVRRQTLFGDSSISSGRAPGSSPFSTTTAAPTPSSLHNSGDDGSASTKTDVWKYAIVVIFVILGVAFVTRVLFLRRERARRVVHNPEDANLPPYRETPKPRTGWLLGRARDTAPPEQMSGEQRRRLRQQTLEIQRALQEAGLLMEPSPARRSTNTRDRERSGGARAAAGEIVAEEESRARRALQERRERRERRRERRRLEEEGAGLPAYTKTKGEDEEVLEMGAGRRRSAGDDSSDDSEDDEDAQIGLTMREYRPDIPHVQAVAHVRV